MKEKSVRQRWRDLRAEGFELRRDPAEDRVELPCPLCGSIVFSERGERLAKTDAEYEALVAGLVTLAEAHLARHEPEPGVVDRRK